MRLSRSSLLKKSYQGLQDQRQYSIDAYNDRGDADERLRYP